MSTDTAARTAASLRVADEVLDVFGGGEGLVFGGADPEGGPVFRAEEPDAEGRGLAPVRALAGLIPHAETPPEAVA